MGRPRTRIIGANKSEMALQRERDLISDAAFQQRMREAIARRLENPLIGVDRRPCTERPRFTMAHRAVSIRSPAQWCAESASSDRLGSDSY